MSEEIMYTDTPTNNTGSKSMYLVIGAVILLLLGGAMVYSQNQNKMQGATTETTQESPMTDTTGAMEADQDTGMMDEEDAMMLDSTSTPSAQDAMMAEDGEVRTITVEAGAFYFKPETITVKKGEKVKIVMTSKDMMHDFIIDELNVKLPITQSGETNTVEFTPTTAGTFEYYCSVGQHRANGQVGTIIVQE